jgi:D-beta-D-heptose 7-phosphate kinase/D-beta-D-heptose 1-phosphate adenosyltransferase
MPFEFLRGHHPKIVVIGDLMLDHYIFCEARGLTPEDPIAPKLRLVEERFVPGGAANVARNLALLGGQVTVLGTCGSDRAGEQLAKLLERDDINTVTPPDHSRPTTTKRRIIAYPEGRAVRKIAHPDGRYICRVDREDAEPVSTDVRSHLCDELSKGDWDMVVVSDYAKGLIQDDVIKAVRPFPYVVDPKKKGLGSYGPALCFTPNSSEAQTYDTLRHHGKALIVTRSGEGATIFAPKSILPASRDDLMKVDMEGRDIDIRKLPVHYREHGDVSGCGDSMIAGLAFALATNACTLLGAAVFGVACGACAVDGEGTHAVTMDDVQQETKHKEYKQDESRDISPLGS